jgi:hypothetical protein
MERTMSEREELARQMAYSGRSPYDRAVNARHFWDNTADSRKEDWLHIAGRILAAGFHRGPKLPEEGTEEEDASVKRMVAAYNAEFNETNRAFARPMRAALRALRETEHE